MSVGEPPAEVTCVAAMVALEAAGGGGVPAGPARGDGVSDATVTAAGAIALLLTAGVAAERGLSVGVGSATITRGVGVTVASGVALTTGVPLASAGTVGNDCGVTAAWARPGVASVATRWEPTAAATIIVTSSTLAAKSTWVDLRHA